MTGSTARWLSAREQHCWRAFVAACESLFGAIDAQLVRDSGIPHGYYEILVHLSEAPDRALRMTQLARASTFSKSRLSHAVTRLEERGWVARQDCPTDRRGQIAVLTDDGHAALAAAAPGHVEQVRRSLIDVLTAEQIERLDEISTAIIEAAGRAGDHACPGCPPDDPADDAADDPPDDPANDPANDPPDNSGDHPADDLAADSFGELADPGGCPGSAG